VLVPRSKEDIVSDVIDLVLLVDTTAPSATTTTTLPLAGTVNVRVDWGDGTGEIFTTTGNKTHVYAAAGQYRVRVQGSLTAFGSTASQPELIGCRSFGRLGITSLFNGFRASVNLTQVPTRLPIGVTNFDGLFLGCTSFNQNIGMWDTSRVTNMNNLLAGATSFNQDIGAWDTGALTTMQSTFSNATAFNQDIGGWDTSNLVSLNFAFNGATSFNQDIGAWNTSKFTNTTHMFFNASSFNQDISGWDLGNATDMSSMMRAVSFDQNLGSWRPSKATTMLNFLLDVTLSTANYDGLLTGWTDFTGTGWNSGAITAFADPGGGQVTVTTATAHGYANGHVMRITGTSNYNGSYVISNVAATSFRITATFVATETGTWNATLQSNVTFHGGNSEYSVGAATTARGVLTGAPYNWTITDGGQA
jgi:surface protein